MSQEKCLKVLKFHRRPMMIKEIADLIGQNIHVTRQNLNKLCREPWPNARKIYLKVKDRRTFRIAYSYIKS